ncbi:unnamed protein product [Urochloa humidicola]
MLAPKYTHKPLLNVLQFSYLCYLHMGSIVEEMLILLFLLLLQLGSTAIGLKTKDGVVLAVEKRVTSPLLEPSSVEKIMETHEHIGYDMSGLIADTRSQACSCGDPES